MEEYFLHFIWQFQRFDKSGLQVKEGAVNILQPGFRNFNAGPDFLQAKVQIAEVSWSGAVEIHIKSSDWQSHRHQLNPNYNQVILHVVWEDDQPVFREDGTPMPTLALKDRVDMTVYDDYRQLVDNPMFIPCAPRLHIVPSIVMTSMQERVAVERLAIKAADVLIMLDDENGNWEQTCYCLLAKNFGFKINSQAFLSTAGQLPFKIIQKHKGNLQQIEALLFGQSGLLQQKGPDDYQQQLQKEFKYLNRKYKLPAPLGIVQWKFMRLRPANFPSLRMAQLAAVLASRQKLFQDFLTVTDLRDIKRILRQKPSAYWSEHYHFGKPSAKHPATIGDAAIENIAINTIAVLQAAYSLRLQDDKHMENALTLLESCKAEDNRIISAWKQLQVKPANARESQALLQLHNHYCTPRLCLSCKIGHNILNPQKA